MSAEKRARIIASLANLAKVEHEAMKSRFVFRGPTLQGEAHLDYVKDGEVLDLTHTFVPQSGRGQNLGYWLAKGAFDYAKENNKKVKLTCTFLPKALAIFPEYEAVVFRGNL